MNKDKLDGLDVRMVEHMTDEQKSLAEDGKLTPTMEAVKAREKTNVSRYVTDPYTGYSDKGIYLN